MGVATAGVLHGGHGGPALYAAGPAAAYHGGVHPDEGLDYHVSLKAYYTTIQRISKYQIWVCL